MLLAATEHQFPVGPMNVATIGMLLLHYTVAILAVVLVKRLRKDS